MASTEQPETKEISSEQLHDMVDSMVSLHTLLKEKKEEVKKINATYKSISERVKAHMIVNELKFIDLRGFQVHTYSRKREAAMNEDFLNGGLQAFFEQENIPVDAGMASSRAASYLLKRKKDKVDGTNVWTMTLRDISKKKVRLNKRKVERLVEDIQPAMGVEAAPKPTITLKRQKTKQNLGDVRVVL
jgi:hypothetical protein